MMVFYHQCLIWTCIVCCLHGEVFESYIDQLGQIRLMRFVRYYGRYAFEMTIVGCYFVVEVESCCVILVLLQHCYTGIITGGFDGEGQQIASLNTSRDLWLTAPC